MTRSPSLTLTIGYNGTCCWGHFELEGESKQHVIGQDGRTPHYLFCSELEDCSERGVFWNTETNTTDTLSSASMLNSHLAYTL